VKILFVMLHAGFVRNYERPLGLLAAAGHDIHVAFEVSRNKLGEDVLIGELQKLSDRITCGNAPSRTESVRVFLARSDRDATRSAHFGRAITPTESGSSRDARRRNLRSEAWECLATTVRLLLDYLRYFEPAYANATRLRHRAEKRLPQIYVGLVRALSWADGPARRLFRAVLHALERIIPINSEVEAFIRRHGPDLVLVTPLIDLGSQQVDYVKCGRRLGIRTALCVASWDNLTNKGVLRVAPDHVLVWNEAQKREAVALHGVSEDRVLITGGQLFDHWFDAQPSRTRDEFCRGVGLAPERPYLMYVGSSQYIAPNEVPFVERWISRLRASDDPSIASSGILLRPHPANDAPWRAMDLTALHNVAIWPPIGTSPYSVESQRDFFDSLYHSIAVVGVNTSAMIEAGIVGRPVLTIRAPEFVQGQEGTLHFQHLLDVEGGLVHAAATLDEHAIQVAAAIRDSTASIERDRRFVRAFVRPLGLDTPATPVFVRAIETLLHLAKPAGEPEPWWVRGLRPLALPAAKGARLLAEDRPFWAYLMRPVIGLIVWIAAAGTRARDGVLRPGRVAAKRFRRGTHAIWYESAQRVGTRARRVRKSIARGIHSARVRVKRMAGRSDTPRPEPRDRKSA
jgi:hypothetical protein